MAPKMYLNHKKTAFEVKYLIGRAMEEPEIKRDLKYLPFMVKENNGAPMISVKYKDEYVNSYAVFANFYRFNHLFSLFNRHLRRLML